MIKGIRIIGLLIFALAFCGCEDDDALLPQIEAVFTHTIDQESGVVTFINASSNADTYSWDFGDGTTSSQINPVKMYSTGTYTIVLTAENAAGASDSYEDTISIQIPEPITLPITFDNPQVSYNATTFGGVSFSVVENPDLSGVNDVASNVGEIVNSGAAFEGLFFDLDTSLNLSDDNSVKMKFWSQSPIDVLLKLEEGTGSDAETTASHGGTGWEELIFTYTSSSSYSRLTLFVDGPGATAGTFYLDDIEQAFVVVGPNCVPETTQSLNAADFNLTFQNDPTASIESDGAGFAWIDNPDVDNSVNSSCKVGQIDRTSAAMFANNQITLDAKLDFNANSGFKMKVWAPQGETEVLLKLEDQNAAGTFKEVFATTSAGSGMQWEELTFNFVPEDSNKYDKIVLFFELGTSTQETYYIDDLALFGDGGGGGTGGGGGGCDGDAVAATSLPVTFEGCESFISTFSSSDATPVTTSLVDNPSQSGINTSDYVMQIIKPSGINRWGGIQNSFPAGTIDFTTQTFKVKVYSSIPDVTYRFEIALDPQTTPVTGNPAPQFRQVTGGANEWVELEFTFINLPPSGSPTVYNQLVIKPDNPDGTDGDVTTEERVYYIDDLRLD
ncbi:PKD domain-containing protein [Sediminibacter sp. Hel_I_10]|uniref:PKD domain-containing protein n=1 Tax=Sediminibacter sp. Hel_I_10 TaxID=1392490 RepID=UPI0018CC249F|nr:PKD domain-containing protein [Sediminibacter sp. Hel_I_10]